MTFLNLGVIGVPADQWGHQAHEVGSVLLNQAEQLLGLERGHNDHFAAHVGLRQDGAKRTEAVEQGQNAYGRVSVRIV